MQSRWVVKVLASGLAFVAVGCPQMPGDDNGAVVEYTADLEGAQEVPPADTDGTGSATMERNGNVLSFEATASGLTGPVMAAHFHNAAAGADGPVVFDLASFLSEENGAVTISGEWTIDDTEIAQLDAGAIYINLHTQQFPDGEIRGQIEMADGQ